MQGFFDNLTTSPIHKNKVAVIGDALFSKANVEIYKKNRKTSVLEQLQGKTMIRADAFNNCKDEQNSYKFQTPINVSWLPFCASHYYISPNIQDYIVVNIPALTSDIPNRNMQGFKTGTLFEFDPNYGCQRFKTFVGRPVCLEHNNKDLRLAQGVIVDAFIIPVPRYKVVKVMLLSLIDRTKCQVTNDILRTGGQYSMGALTGSFNCSICGGDLGPGVVRTCTCLQTDYNNLASYGRVYDGRLHYIMANDPVFGEISIIVTSPADITALGETLL